MGRGHRGHRRRSGVHIMPVDVQSCRLASPFTLSAPRRTALTGRATKADREPTVASSSASALAKGRGIKIIVTLALKKSPVPWDSRGEEFRQHDLSCSPAKFFAGKRSRLPEIVLDISELRAHLNRRHSQTSVAAFFTFANTKEGRQVTWTNLSSVCYSSYLTICCWRCKSAHFWRSDAASTGAIILGTRLRQGSFSLEGSQPGLRVFRPPSTRLNLSWRPLWRLLDAPPRRGASPCHRAVVGSFP